MKKLFGILILTLTIVLAVGATSFAAEKTIVDEFTDLTKVYSSTNAYVNNSIPWNDSYGVHSSVVKDGSMELIYSLPEKTTQIVIDSYYMNTGSGVYAEDLEFSVSSNSSTWNVIDSGSVNKKETANGSNGGVNNRAWKQYVYTLENIPEGNNYIKITTPHVSTWTNRWYVVIDTVKITYEEVIKVPTYTFTDNLTDAANLYSYDSTILETEWTNAKWLLVDTHALIPKDKGDIPVITYKFDDEITGFSIDTVYAKFAVNGVEQWATDFTFEVSANGEDWVPITAERTDGTEKNPGGGAVVKEVDYSASNIGEGNYYLRITFGDNTAVTKRWAVALDTVKVTCALGENTLTMANGESGTIYCSESTDSSKVTATIVAKDTSSKNAIAILATYNSANKLVNVQTKDVAFNTTEDLSCERLILPVANSAKLMILNSLGTLVPMTVVNPIQ